MDSGYHKDALRCSLFLYSPLMANVKFMGSITAWFVHVSNEFNYFNSIYFSLNMLSEVVLSSLPLLILSVHYYREYSESMEDAIFYVQSIILTVCVVAANLVLGVYFMVCGVRKRRDYYHILRVMKGNRE